MLGQHNQISQQSMTKSPKQTRTRIAPSPTGMPHVGTLFQALIDYIIAKQDNGQFIVRIEDTDQGRYVEGAEEAIYQAFEWAGIHPDESPKLGGDYGPYRQSQRLETYQKYAQQLIDQGDAYYCFCSPDRLDQVRKDFQKQGKPPMYDKHCRDLDPQQSAQKAKSEKHVIRMKIPQDQTITFTDAIRGQISFESNLVDDQVILKSDGFPTYHLAVVVDDHHMEITHIVRGEEWISSTPKHILLYQYLGWEMPSLIHTPLLRNPDKSKLGKRHGHASVSWYQDNGYLPQALINFLATRVWNHPSGDEIFSLDELIKHFKVDQMHIQGPIIDISKLDWYNGIYIRNLSDQQLSHYLKPYLEFEIPDTKLVQIIPLVKERLVKLSDINQLVDFFATDLPLESKLLLKKSTPEEVDLQLQQTIDQIHSITDWNLQNIESTIRQLQEKHDWHKGQYFMMIRIAVTSKKATPPLFETIQVLGKDKVINRLSNAQKLIQTP